MDMTSLGLSMRSLWEPAFSLMPHSRSMSCIPNYPWKTGLAGCSSVKGRRVGMGLAILSVTLRARAAWILSVILVEDCQSLFAQLAFPLVWNLGVTEAISVLSAIVTIMLKRLFSFSWEPYSAMLCLQCCHLAASLVWDHLVSDVKQLSRLSIRALGHERQKAGSASQTWNRSTAPHSYKWKAAEHPDPEMP